MKDWKILIRLCQAYLISLIHFIFLIWTMQKKNHFSVILLYYRCTFIRKKLAFFGGWQQTTFFLLAFHFYSRVGKYFSTFFLWLSNFLLDQCARPLKRFQHFLFSFESCKDLLDLEKRIKVRIFLLCYF